MTETDQPLYMKIYNYILEKIENKEFKPGNRLPSENELSSTFGVSRITSKKSLELLASDGYIVRVAGKGSFVSDTLPETNTKTTLNNNAPVITKKLIGVLIPDFSNIAGAKIISAIEKIASENGFFIIPKRSYGNQANENQAIDELLHLGVDGLIIMPVVSDYYNEKLVKLILDGFPVVLIDRNLTGIPVTFVGSNNYEAGKKTTEYLFNLNHKTISVFSPSALTPPLFDRIQGIVKSHRENNIPINVHKWLTTYSNTLPGHEMPEELRKDIDNIKSLLMDNPDISAIIALHWGIFLLTRYAISELKQEIGKDYSVIVFDALEGENEVTHVKQDEFSMGTQAFKEIYALITDKENYSFKNILLDVDLIPSNSTKYNKGAVSN